jgi:RNA polymerase sigma-70 factor (ECF subfamily)
LAGPILVKVYRSKSLWQLAGAPQGVGRNWWTKSGSQTKALGAISSSEVPYKQMQGNPDSTAPLEIDEEGPPLQATVPPLEAGAPTDLELMQGIQKGDPEALSQLYDRYNGIIKALILRVIHNDAEADDLLQEIFMEIWNQAKNFSAQRGKPLGWMVTLARRRAIDGLRKKQAYARAEERLKGETEQQPEAWMHNATETEISLGDTRQLIRTVIDSLPPLQQEAVELAFFQGMSQREIAAKTNTPLGTVKTRLELGLKKIYDGLKELKDEL